MYWGRERIETLVGLLRDAGKNFSQENLEIAVIEVYNDLHGIEPAKITLENTILVL